MTALLPRVFLLSVFCFTATLALTSVDVYGILSRRNVWDIINNWTRPEGTVTHKFPKRQDTFPLDLMAIEIPSIEVKFINDTERGFTIYSVSYTEIQKLRPSVADLIHEGHRIPVAVNSCGRGVCFIQEEDGATITLIIVQKNTMLADDYRDLSVSIYLTASQREHIIVQLHPPVESGGPPRLMNYIMSPYDQDILRADNYSPSYSITYSQNGGGVQPDDENKARIDTHIHRDDNEPFPQLMYFDYFAGPGKYKTTNVNLTAINGSDVIYSEEVDLNDPVFNDAMVTSTLRLQTSRDRDPHNLAVYIKLEKVYFILQEGETMPKTVRDHWNLCNAAPEYVEIGEIFVLGCTVFHAMPVTVSWAKLNGGQFVEVDGFQINNDDFSYYTSSSIINYATRTEDAGLYQFQVYKNGSSEIFRTMNFTISIWTGEIDRIH